MDNISFHITDITANSIRAGATEIVLSIRLGNDITDLCIEDNGCGMDAETVKRVTNPFYTSRTTRKVGLGLPFLVQNAEQTGGCVAIDSTPGKGTKVSAHFISSNIDCPPMGNLPATVAMLIAGNPEIDIRFRYETDGIVYDLSTKEIKEILDGIPINHPKVIVLIEQMIRENIG